MYKYLFGSKMLKLDNSRDEDWLTFTTECGKKANELGQKSIPFYKQLLTLFKDSKNIKADPFFALYLYQLSNGFIKEEDYPFSDFNIFEYKTAWIGCLKAYVNHKKTEEWAKKQETLSKQFYHLLYQYNMIIENVHFISDEAKINVQKIHDLEMPSSYFYELRDLINSL